MEQEELVEGTSVFTPGGDELGEINRFVLEPNTNQVTHIVIRGGGMVSEDKLVPFDRVSTGEDGRLELDEEIEEYDRLPPFEQAHFIEVSDLDRETRGRGEYPFYVSGPAYYWYPPFGFHGYPDYGLGRAGFPRSGAGQQIPTGTVTLLEGIGVLSADGEQAGLVKRLLVDEVSEQITHFLVSEDPSYQEHKLVPVGWVRSVDEEFIRLHVSSRLLDGLSLYEGE